jgi:hypothetical protein
MIDMKKLKAFSKVRDRKLFTIPLAFEDMSCLFVRNK